MLPLILMRQVLLTLGSMGGTEVRNVFHSFWSAWFRKSRTIASKMVQISKSSNVSLSIVISSGTRCD
jgi:hypothetical protein